MLVAERATADYFEEMINEGANQRRPRTGLATNIWAAFNKAGLSITSWSGQRENQHRRSST